jgi:hypothetical protein
MPAIRWHRVAEDGTIWSADPEPSIHLAVWLDGKAPWAWHALDERGNVLEWGFAQSLEVSKTDAEAWYLARRAIIMKKAMHPRAKEKSAGS